MGLHTGPLALQATAQNTRQYNIFHQKIEVLIEGILLFTLASALRQYFLWRLVPDNWDPITKKDYSSLRHFVSDNSSPTPLFDLALMTSGLG